MSRKDRKGLEKRIKNRAELLRVAFATRLYDTAINAALQLTMEEPIDEFSSEHKDPQSEQRATENLITRLPGMPFKDDFIDGMKIIGRQGPIKEFVTDLRGRLRAIGGGIGALFDETTFDVDTSQQ